MGANCFLAALVLLLATGAAAAEKGVPAPDPEFLEYLGTFETSAGKDIDPLLLESDVAKGAEQGKRGAGRPAAGKRKPEKGQAKGKEKGDE